VFATNIVHAVSAFIEPVKLTPAPPLTVSIDEPLVMSIDTLDEEAAPQLKPVIVDGTYRVPDNVEALTAPPMLKAVSGGHVAGIVPDITPLP